MFRLVSFMIILAKSVVGSNNEFECNGDICNSGQAMQFCSSSFMYCRDCAAIVESCGQPEQPLNCSLFCDEYHLKKKMTEAKEKDCAALNEVYNGRHNGSLSGMHNVGDVVEFCCNDGYILLGQSSVKCKEYGVWSNAPPTCNEVLCQSLPKIQNGRHNGSLTFLKPGDVVVTSCSYGYTLYGEKITVCDSKGVWIHPLPTCQKTVCLKPHPIRNLLWPESSSRAYQVGHSLKPTCEENSIMNGSDLWNCSTEGTWISRDGEYMPVCVLKGESSDQNTCLSTIELGIPLILSVVLNGGLVLVVIHFIRHRQQHHEQFQTDPFDDRADIERATLLNKKGDAEMNETLVSFRTSKQVVFSGKEVPPTNTENQDNDMQHLRTRFANTRQECNGQGNLILHDHNSNNNTNNNTINSAILSDTEVKQTKERSPPSAKQTKPISCYTTQENDNRPVEESGADQPQQPESACENTERKLSFDGHGTDMLTTQGNSDLENISNSNARPPVQITTNNEQDRGQKMLLPDREINTDDVM